MNSSPSALPLSPNTPAPPALLDAIVIGGGPGGTSAATYLARSSHRVLLLEKEVFPRFHIGESLLPYNREIFEEIGIWPELAAAGFPVKTGAQFHIGNDSKSLFFVFRQGRFTRETSAIQVERSLFDHLLLKHARRCGADVREGWTVSRFRSHKESVGVDATDPHGATHQFQARFLIDASGRGNLTGNQDQLRVLHPRLKKIAVFGHFNNVALDPGEKGGDTVIIRLANKWFWIIPLAGKVSAGCVLEQSELANAQTAPADLFFQICRSTPAVHKRMAAAELIGRIQTTGDFSYYNRRLVGEHLLRVGDAAGFMDPIFSAGVFLAMFSGRLAAQTVTQSLARPGTERRLLRRYEKRVRSAMHFYWRMVDYFYTTPFLEIFFEPREKFSIASAVNAALAGSLDAGWRLRWRMNLFFWIVKFHRHWPLAPKIHFD